MGQTELDRVRWIKTYYPVSERDAMLMVSAGLTNTQISAAVIAWTQGGGMFDLGSIVQLILMEAPMPRPEDLEQLGHLVAASPTQPGTHQRRAYADHLLVEFTGITRRRRR